MQHAIIRRLGTLSSAKVYSLGLVYLVGIFVLIILLISIKYTHLFDSQQKLTQTNQDLNSSLLSSQTQNASLSAVLASTSAELALMKLDDQYVRNNQLEAQIESIENTYNKTVSVYEALLKLKTIAKDTSAQDKNYAQIISLLANHNYATAGAKLKELSATIVNETDKITSSFVIPANIPVNNTPPGSGYSRQQVQIDIGAYLVSIVSADLNSTRIIVDTASDGTCTNDCPVTSLGDYVSRSGGFAGINGPYFCPASYPSCAGKTNSFDTLLMNKNKVYFNSDNNVYSTVPAVVFSGSSANFVGQSLNIGRDTSPDSVIASQPLLVSGGNVVFGGDGDPKKGSKSTRGFIGATGSTVYIGHVHNATVAESARVLQAMGIQNALNLDGGGSVALWSGGYKVGPGRALPFGIILVRK